MYSKYKLAGKYLHYYLTAANGKGHGTHSPFVFDFITRVLNDHRHYPAYTPIEQLRRTLRRDPRLLELTDLGAGSVYKTTTTRSIASIARHAAKPPKWGQLLYRVARHYSPGTMLELGTSLGLSTAYLAAGAPQARLWTIEGAPAIADKARGNLSSLGVKANVLTGNFDSVLPGLLKDIPPVELAFIDGNHRCEPTLQYFDTIFLHTAPSSTLIFDDIHWSKEMETAWDTIRNDPRVYLTIDLFFIGFVFRRDEFKVKQDFSIRF
ncbi:MAG TPA: class I SAM-dependent methyltransferase [Puia sp.]|nr:class I SAM-dependent methyltransferase [Puia sp.]